MTGPSPGSSGEVDRQKEINIRPEPLDPAIPAEGLVGMTRRHDLTAPGLTGVLAVAAVALLVGGYATIRRVAV